VWAAGQRKRLKGVMEQESEVLLDLSNLGTELLTKVFGYLGKIKDKTTIVQVCDDWRIAAYHPCLWRNVQVKVNLSDPLPPHVHHSLQKRRFRHMEISYCCELETLRAFLAVMPSLRSLRMRCFKHLSDADLKELSIQGPSALEKAVEMSLCLRIKRWETRNKRRPCFDICAGIKDESLKVLGSEARQLEVLNLSGCLITNEGLKHLGVLGLEELTIRHCYFVGCVRERFQMLSEGFKALKCLIISGRNATESEVLTFVCEHPSLEYLYLTDIRPAIPELEFARIMKESVKKIRPNIHVETSLGALL